MNRDELMVKLQEAAELVSCHIGDVNLEWEIVPKRYSNKAGELILTFKAEYEDDEEE